MTAELRLFCGDGPDQPVNPTGGHTVQSVIDWFVTHSTPSRSKVASTERRRIFALFCKRFGPALVADVIGADLVDFVQAQERVKAGNTIDRWYRTIKRPFCEAERLGMIMRSPFKGVRSPKGNEGRDLTVPEFRQLLRSATPAFRRVLTFLRFSGARPAELIGLLWCHVLIDEKVILLWQHKTVHKTGKPRRIYLNSVLVKLLVAMKRKSESEFVFVNSYGGQWKTRALCKNVAKIREKAGLPDDVKLYGTRHMHGTGAIVNGVDIATLAQLMGHTNTRTTERYIHLAGQNDHLAKAAEQAIKKPR